MGSAHYYLSVFRINWSIQMPRIDSDDVESDAHSLELIECVFTNLVAFENIAVDGLR